MAAINLRYLLLLRRSILLKILLHQRRKKKAEKYKKRFWVRKLYSERKQKGVFNILVADLKLYDEEVVFQYFRMSPSVFEELLCWVAPLIQKKSTPMGERV